jgi:hypothetical protein
LRLPIRRAIFSALPVSLLAVFLCNCAVPIAPGYRINREPREIRFVAGSPSAIHVQTTYSLENSGNSELNFVDVTLPPTASYGLADVRAQLDGRDAELSKLPQELRFDFPDAMRMGFSSPWRQGAKQDLTVDYSFRSPNDEGSRITLNDAAFHLGSRGAFVALNPPKHLLAPYPRRPKEMYYSVVVPKDFRVLARGTPAGRKEAAGGDVEYRYRLLATDLAPFVVAGRYVESAPLGDSGPIFWTFQPVSIDPATARAVLQSWNTLQTDFGPLDKNIHGPHIVEVANLPEHISGEQGVAAVAFPGGALVSSAALAQGVQSEEFIEAVSHALAHNWFGDEMYPVADATLVLGEGLPEYAMIAIDEDRGGQAARQERIRRYLVAYDDAVREGNEETLAVSRLTDPPAVRRIALAKAPLFFAALEDECGPDAMRSASREVVMLMRGEEVGYPAIRAALEGQSGKNLAATFRLWLNEKGIPQDFRERYEAGTGR